MLLEKVQSVIASARTTVLQARGRMGLPATTPVLDRVENMVRQRAARRGLFGGPTVPPAPAPVAPAPAPAPATETQTYMGQFIEPEEFGIEAR